jgi:hypothetical protein
MSFRKAAFLMGVCVILGGCLQGHHVMKGDRDCFRRGLQETEQRGSSGGTERAFYRLKTA